MAAIFYNLDDTGIFKANAGTSANLVKCSLFDSVLSGQSFTVMTAMSLSFSETVQFFQSFDDLIHYYYFGKGLGQMRFELLVFGDCSGSHSQGLNSIYSAIGAHRGQVVALNTYQIRVEGVLMDFTVNCVADPIPHFQISIGLGMINSNLTKPNITGAC